MRAFYDMPFIFNIPFCVEFILFPSGMIVIFLCFIWKMLVAGTLEVMSWWPDQVSDMNVPCGFCVEEGGGPVVYTLSKSFGLIYFYYLIYYYLTLHIRGPVCFRPAACLLLKCQCV